MNKNLPLSRTTPEDTTATSSSDTETSPLSCPNDLGSRFLFRLRSLFLIPATSSSALFAAALGSILASGFASFLFWMRAVAPGALRYADTNLPMLDTPDAFFFLARTHEMLQHGLEFSSVSALSTVLALIHEIIWIEPEVTGFWLPLLFLIGFGLTFALWGRLFRLPAIPILLAVLIATLIPCWSSRVHIGSLDTDGGIYLLLSLSLYTIARLSLPEAASLRTKTRILLWVRFLCCGLLLAWFWHPGALLLAGALWLWCASWSWSASPRERRLRRQLAFILPVLALLALVVSPKLLPAGLVNVRELLLNHISVILNPQEGLIYRSIAELQPMDLFAWLGNTGGSPLGGGIMAVGFLLLLQQAPRQALFLLPCVLLQLMAFFSNRFLYFGVLPMALGIASLPITLPRLLGMIPLQLGWRTRTSESFRPLPGAQAIMTPLVICAALLVLQGEAKIQANATFEPTIAKNEDLIALYLKKATAAAQAEGQPTALFHWWDEGYFLHYRTGIRPLFDGGSQNPLTAFIAAHPFVVDDPLLARRWIRYFALHRGELAREGWTPLLTAWGDEETVLRELTALYQLSDADIPARIAAWPALKLNDGRILSSNADKAAWLFPNGRVFAYLPVRFIQIASWWMAMGSELKAGPEALHTHVERFPLTEFNYDPQTNQVTLPPQVTQRGYTKAGALYIPSPDQPFSAPWGADKEEPLLIVPKQGNWLYIANKTIARSIGFRLLAPSYEQIPGFVPVAVNYASAGAWEILP